MAYMEVPQTAAKGKLGEREFNKRVPLLIETKKWQFPFLPWPPAGLGCWERHTSPLYQAWLGKSTEKALPVSRRRYGSNHGRDLWTS